jgi:uncharacterized protein DUF892
MAAYGSARTLAEAIGNKRAAALLEETLQEEKETDKQLSQIAKRLIKQSGSLVSGERESRRESTKSSGNGRSAAGGQKSSRGRNGGQSRNESSGHVSHMTTDHEEIRQWAEERGARPACVKGTGGKSDTGMIRLDFPGYSGARSLQPISWEDFFQKFDENGLALVYQETTAKGQESNFNKLVSREQEQTKGRSKTPAAATRNR